MAILNTVPFRPLCVVSALPNRYRRELERRLEGSVAFSTCGVEQLEDAVRLRGATIAVVGASENSWEIAERLSHSSEGLKVYLAHYQDKLSTKGPLNGFAGVFDLRIEQQQLAESIRQEVVALNLSVRPVSRQPSRRSLLEHFVAINERLSRPPLAYELMLDGFLDLAGAEAGALLLCDESSEPTCSVVAYKDCELLDPDGITIPRDLATKMAKGEVLFLPKGLPGIRCHSWHNAIGYCLGVPLLVGKQLVGYFIAQTNEASEILQEFASAVGHLLSRMKRQQAAFGRNELVYSARKRVAASWMIADGIGRIIYSEEGATKCNFHSSHFDHGPLAHAVSEAMDGIKGTVVYKGQIVSYERLSGSEGEFALLRLEPDYASPIVYQNAQLDDPRVIHFVKVQLSQSAATASLVDGALKLIKAAHHDPSVNIDSVREAGIEVASQEPSLNLLPGVALIVLAIKQAIQGKISFSLTRHSGVIGLGFEISEEAVDRHPSFLESDFLIETILRFTGMHRFKPRWTFGFFGGRFEWSEHKH